MIKKNVSIEIVSSKDKTLSSMSDPSRRAIQKTLSKHYVDVRITLLETMSDLEGLVLRQPDVVVLGVKQLIFNNQVGERVVLSVASYLEKNGVTATGSGSLALEQEQNKDKAKKTVLDAGLATAPFFIITEDEYNDEKQLPLKLPLFLKPSNRGAGVGVDANSVVRNFKQFKAKVKSLINTGNQSILAEKYLIGREFTAAVMLSRGRERLLVMPIEQIPFKNSRGDGVIGHEMKESKDETPVDMVKDITLRRSLMVLAEGVFTALGAGDYGRIDMRLDEKNQPQFLEANLIPGLIDGSGNFQKACQMNIGMSYEKMIVHIVELALNRKQASGSNQQISSSRSPVLAF